MVWGLKNCDFDRPGGSISALSRLGDVDELEVVGGVDDGSPPRLGLRSGLLQLATGFGAVLHYQARSESSGSLAIDFHNTGLLQTRLDHLTSYYSCPLSSLASPSLPCYSSSSLLQFSPFYSSFVKKRGAIGTVYTEKEPLRSTRAMYILQVNIESILQQVVIIDELPFNFKPCPQILPSHHFDGDEDDVVNR